MSQTLREGVDYDVVWNGRGPLLPERSERWDTRFNGMPTYDIDDDEAKIVKPKRKYTLTGRYKGVFSRTNPKAAQYSPRREAGGHKNG